MSADYRFSGMRRTERFRSLRDARGLGTFTPLMIPFRLTGPLLSAFSFIQDARQKAAVDQQMWTIDQQWSPPHTGATFRDMRTCVRVSEVGGGVETRAWRTLPDDQACRNVDGRVFSPNCRWGYWELLPCNMQTATQFMFQYTRYLWAQGRLREMLVTKPVRGVTSPQAAADWVWLANQYISVMLWSTNVRFDPANDYSGSYYEDEYVRAGLYLAPETQPFLNVIYGDVTPRLLNVLDGDPLSQRNVPVSQEWFSPGNPQHLMWMVPETTTDNSRIYRLPDGSTYNSSTPIGLTNEQRRDIQRAATAIQTASGTIESYRWAEARAFLNWSFAATWNENWPSPWRQVTTVSLPQRGGRWTNPQPLMAGGAQVVLDKTVRLVTHYADPHILFTDWMHAAITAYDVQLAALPLPTNVRVDWTRARDQMNTQLTSAASFERGAIGMSTGGAVSSSLWSLVSLFGGVAAIAATIMQAVQQIAFALFAAFGVTVNERHPCPAMPFLRITTGDCDLSEDTITASILGIDSGATWPLSFDRMLNKTLTFVIDGAAVHVVFSSETTADAVARKINSAAALALPSGHPTVASVRRNQVHVEGADPASGPVRITGGTAAALRFPGPVQDTEPSVGCPDGSRAASTALCPPAAAGGTGGAPRSSGGMLLGLTALAALAAWAATRKKDPATMETP